MVDKRLKLHELLVGILNNQNAYFQPPSNIKMNYPAIKYELADIRNSFADNIVYKQSRKYTITFIDWDPDNAIIDTLSQLPSCEFDRQYQKDNLNHTIFTITY